MIRCSLLTSTIQRHSSIVMPKSIIIMIVLPSQMSFWRSNDVVGFPTQPPLGIAPEGRYPFCPPPLKKPHERPIIISQSETRHVSGPEFPPSSSMLFGVNSGRV